MNFEFGRTQKNAVFRVFDLSRKFFLHLQKPKRFSEKAFQHIKDCQQNSCWRKSINNLWRNMNLKIGKSQSFIIFWPFLDNQEYNGWIEIFKYFSESLFHVKRRRLHPWWKFSSLQFRRTRSMKTEFRSYLKTWHFGLANFLTKNWKFFRNNFCNKRLLIETLLERLKQLVDGTSNWKSKHINKSRTFWPFRIIRIPTKRKKRWFYLSP